MNKTVPYKLIIKNYNSCHNILINRINLLFNNDDILINKK